MLGCEPHIWATEVTVPSPYMGHKWSALPYLRVHLTFDRTFVSYTLNGRPSYPQASPLSRGLAAPRTLQTAAFCGGHRVRTRWPLQNAPRIVEIRQELDEIEAPAGLALVLACWRQRPAAEHERVGRPLHEHGGDAYDE